MNKSKLLVGLLSWYVLLWIVLAIDPRDRQDWLLENLLALTAVVALAATYRRFQFSTPSYLLITAFLSLHAVGAHYTYAEVPAGFWLQHLFGLSRNPFDRLVHFSYGLLLAFPLREILIRLAGVRVLWSFYLAVSGMLAQSGLFEIVEAVVAQTVSPELGAAYLGTQGDEWDAQNDMIAATAGALLCMAMVFLSTRGGRVLRVRKAGTPNAPARRGAYFFTISSSSTSNTNVAPGLIVGGEPRSP